MLHRALPFLPEKWAARRREGGRPRLLPHLFWPASPFAQDASDLRMEGRSPGLGDGRSLPGPLLRLKAQWACVQVFPDTVVAAVPDSDRVPF